MDEESAAIDLSLTTFTLRSVINWIKAALLPVVSVRDTLRIPWYTLLDAVEKLVLSLRVLSLRTSDPSSRALRIC